MISTKRITILFLAILVIFISAPAFLLVRYEVTGRHKRLVECKLAGIFVPQQFPALSMNDFLTGKFQKNFSNWLQENLGLRERFIRANNQLYYSLFDKSYQLPDSGGIIIGKEHQLYEYYFIREYTSEHPRMSINDQNHLVSKIKKVQDLLKRRGVSFILFVTPSKAYTYPEYIPDAFLKHKQRATTYDSIVPLLNKAGVNVVDGQRIILDWKKKSEFPMFPRGGTHWTYLGAYYVTAELAAKIEQLTNKSIPEMRLTGVDTKKPPEGTDKDLAELLNLLNDPLDYIAPMPVISICKKNNGSQTADASLAIVGGSFTYQPFRILADQKMFKSAFAYNYYILSLEKMPESQMLQKADYDPRTSIWWHDNFLKDDVIILEINVTMFAGNHVKAFLDDALRIESEPFKRSNVKKTVLRDAGRIPVQ